MKNCYFILKAEWSNLVITKTESSHLLLRFQPGHLLFLESLLFANFMLKLVSSK